MDKRIAIGIAAGAASLAGIAMGAAFVLAVKKNFGKVFGEMQDDVSEQVFTSPDGDNTVKVVFGASETAKGMALVSVTATSEVCTNVLLSLARKGDNLIGCEWTDNNNLKLWIGSTNQKQCCDISFGAKKIVMNYSLQKITSNK